MSTTTEIRDDELRQQAIKRLEKRSEFWGHLAVYLVVNALIVTVWFLVSDGGFFWPLFPLFGWGIGLLFHAVDAFRRPYSEERIRREMDRLS
jgi:cytochrome b561